MEKQKCPELRFSQYKNDWDETTLGDVVDIAGGGTPDTSVPEFWNGDIDWYSPTEIGENVYANGSIKKITASGLKNSSAKILPAKKTVLFSSRAGIGDMAILNKPAATNQGFQSFIANNIDVYFLYSMGSKIKKFALSKASGSTFLEISRNQLSQMEFFAPSGESGEQNQIGHFFQNLDQSIALHEKKLAQTQNLKKAMLEKMFPKAGSNQPEIRLKGFSGDWGSISLGSLCQIGDIDHRMPESTKSGIPYLMTGDFFGINGLDFENAKLISNEDYELLSKKIKPEIGDILFARYASVGTVRLVVTDIKFLISYSCAILKTSVNSSGEYLFFWFQTNFAQNQIEQEINTGSQRNIGIDSLKKLSISLPKDNEQKAISNFFKNLDETLALQQQQLQTLKNLKQAFLEKMFV